MIERNRQPAIINRAMRSAKVRRTFAKAGGEAINGDVYITLRPKLRLAKPMAHFR